MADPGGRTRMGVCPGFPGAVLVYMHVLHSPKEEDSL